MNVSRRNAAAAYSMPRVLREMLDKRDLWEPLGKVARANHVTLDECFSPSRKSHIVKARRAMFHFLRDNMSWSYPGIGDLFGLHHTTVMAALRPALPKMIATAYRGDVIAEAAE